MFRTSLINIHISFESFCNNEDCNCFVSLFWSYSWRLPPWGVYTKSHLWFLQRMERGDLQEFRNGVSWIRFPLGHPASKGDWSNRHNYSIWASCSYFSTSLQTKWTLLKVSKKIFLGYMFLDMFFMYLFFCLYSVTGVWTDKQGLATDAIWMQRCWDCLWLCELTWF